MRNFWNKMSGLAHHLVLRNPLNPPFPENTKMIMFGMGCYWGAEKAFWSIPGVYSTHVGFTAGHTRNPTYEQVCSHTTGHNEVVRVVYDPQQVTLWRLLKSFWENHDPTQVGGQGNDMGDNYRSGIYVYSEDDIRTCQRAKDIYQQALTAKGFGRISTEVLDAETFYYGPDDHQQYLHSVPWGYCGHGQTGVKFDYEGN